MKPETILHEEGKWYQIESQRVRKGKIMEMVKM